MSNKTETMTIEVEETVIYRHTFAVTDGLLSQAYVEGYDRTTKGVLEMLQADPDHEIVANDATTPRNFFAVAERNTEEVTS